MGYASLIAVLLKTFMGCLEVFLTLSENSIMGKGITRSERFVSELCSRSFLRLWTHPNPKGKKGKELCDCLVVCGSHIVIISVKECKYRETGDITGWERWIRDALDKSYAQIVGAERWLDSVEKIERNDGREIALPPKKDRNYHRMAVALGAKGHVPLKWGDFGKGFIHVCDEYSVGSLFAGLDTITDFVNFLKDSENLIRNGTSLHFAGGGIEDLVALYITNGRSFEYEDGIPSLLIIEEGLWETLVESQEYNNMKEDLKASYTWDRLIDQFTNDLLSDGMFDMHSMQVTRNELALVEMALQPRGHRAVLAERFLEYFEKPELKSAARVIKGYGASAFVFMAGSSSDREARCQELALRCLVVRGRMPGVSKVIGIATDRPGTSSIGYSSEIAYVEFPAWSDELEEKVIGIQEELGYFKDTKWR